MIGAFGVENHLSLVRGHLGGEAAALVERAHDLDTVGRRDVHVLLTERGARWTTPVPESVVT